METKKKKKDHGAFKPQNTLQKELPWMKGMGYAAPSTPPVQRLSYLSTRSIFRTASPTHPEEPPPKRARLDPNQAANNIISKPPRDPTSSFDGQVGSFRAVEGTVRPTKPRSQRRRVSSSTFSQADSFGSTPGPVKNVYSLVDRGASKGSSFETETSDVLPTKEVASSQCLRREPTSQKRTQEQKAGTEHLVSPHFPEAGANKKENDEGPTKQRNNAKAPRDRMSAFDDDQYADELNEGADSVRGERRPAKATRGSPRTLQRRLARPDPIEDSAHEAPAPERLAKKFTRDEGPNGLDPLQASEEEEDERIAKLAKEKKLAGMRPQAISKAQKPSKLLIKGPDDPDTDAEQIQSYGTGRKQLRHRRKGEPTIQSYNLELAFICPKSYEGPGVVVYIPESRRGFQIAVPDVIDEYFALEHLKKCAWSESTIRFEGPSSSQGPKIIHMVFQQPEDTAKFRARIRSMDPEIAMSEKDEEKMLKTIHHSIKFHSQPSETRSSVLRTKANRTSTENTVTDARTKMQASGEESRKRAGDTASGILPNRRKSTRLITGSSDPLEPAGRATRKRDDMLSSANPSNPPNPKASFFKSGSLGTAWKKALVYPQGGPRTNVATVDWNDLERLDDDEFLNDNLISFGLRWELEHSSAEVKDQVHCFNTYFYASLTKMTAGKKGINYDAVKRWTSRLAKNDLFQYNYIIVPICERMHWYAAIVCNVHNLQHDYDGDDKGSSPVSREGPLEASERDGTYPSDPDPVAREQSMEAKYKELSLEDVPEVIDPDYVHKIHQRAIAQTPNGKFKNDHVIEGATAEPLKSKSGRTAIDPLVIVLDSLGNPHYDVVHNIKEYLLAEASSKRNSKIVAPVGVTARGIPVQQNYSDCGLYLLAYVRKFLDNPDEFISRALAKDAESKAAWSSFSAETLRDDFRTIVVAEGKKQNDVALTEAEMKVLYQPRCVRGVTKGVRAGADVAVQGDAETAIKALLDAPVMRASAPLPKPQRQASVIERSSKAENPVRRDLSPAVVELLPGLIENSQQSSDGDGDLLFEPERLKLVSTKSPEVDRSNYYSGANRRRSGRVVANSPESILPGRRADYTEVEVLGLDRARGKQGIGLGRHIRFDDGDEYARPPTRGK